MAFLAVLRFLLLLVAFIPQSEAVTSDPTTIDVCCPKRKLTYVEEWDYFTVRPNANLFYWLYYEKQSSDDAEATKKPWFSWLQGGPGASSTGFGNFQEIGPLDVNLKPRDTTWLSRGDLLFIDSPVGTGYSYVTTDSAYTRNVDDIARDLTDFTIHFIETHPEYKDRPYYITCESYGGKVSAVYAWHLYRAIQQGRVSMNFRGVGLGDSWISPIDFVDTWPEYLYYFSRLSDDGLAQMKKQAEKCDNYVNSGKWSQATTCWQMMESQVMRLSGGVSFYNVLKQSGEDPWSLSASTASAGSNYPLSFLYYQSNDQLDDLMNGPMRKKLGIIPDSVRWGGQSGTVFDEQSEDFMKPVIETVDSVLNNTDLTIFIYNGQLDLICDTAGVERWVSKLKWADLTKFEQAPKKAVKDKYSTGVEPAAFVQSYKHLYFFWILKAGHMVPADTPTASLTMLDMITAL